MADDDATDLFRISDSDRLASQADISTSEIPRFIGRYRVEKLLGKGGFGLVYLAHDEQLSRPVAIKVPHAHLLARPDDAGLYATEARTVANLDHPNIVPVHDVGSTAETPFFIVSKFIDGADLATVLKDSQLSHQQAAELVATVAEALHHAHRQGLVHRDIKPGNILIDKGGKPFVVDFGLALREQDVGKGSSYVGTPAYMSPEQARGEGHRVDGRSDIFSLGVVFYELLVGRRPFRGDLKAEVLEQIVAQEPRPLRQYNDTIPKELDRICLKMLSKKATERYSTAKDVSDDLRHFLKHAAGDAVSSLAGIRLGADTPVGTNLAGDTPAATPTPSSPPIKIIPKGLRSFDEHDADFFLELLPGPRDRDGLPESIRFWKTRIEETDPDKTFSVGLIYGPSGCGKSSLVKAGLLPRLSEDVIVVYIEATADETESRLLKGLRRHCSGLTDNLSLKDTLAALRRGQGITIGKKVLIVLDQFEQWLHAKKDGENSELVHALRQCDGEHVQCIVMVRDDFWLAVSRFARELEIRFFDGQNSALADLFDSDHARKVLAAFGRAFSKLSEHELSKDQKEFLKQAVTGLADDGKVICVRLALFAEMMKSKTWTVATLKEVGGAQGIGTTFLEETFGASNAPPEHRYHQKSARAVLKTLLPESGTDIKGHMKSYAELLNVSGYATHPKDFDDLIRILDIEIRLITPTDLEGSEVAHDAIPSVAGKKYFQLAHDFLVPLLRDWLNRKQKETRRGRAELRLAERSAFWNSKPENRHLPSLWEFLNIHLLTKRKNWTEPQRRMMKKAGRVRSTRYGLTAAVLVVLTLIGLAFSRQIEEKRQVDALMAKLVANTLFTQADDRPDYFLNVLGEVEELQFQMRAVGLHGRGRSAIALLEAELSKHVSEDASRLEKEALTKRKANAAVALMHIGQNGPVWPLLKESTDPSARSYFIHWLSPLGCFVRLLSTEAGNVRPIIERLQVEPDVTIRRALVLTLGEFARSQLSLAQREPIIGELRTVYEDEPDPGLHGAAEWLLRKWGQAEWIAAVDNKLQVNEQQLRTNRNNQRRWYINTQGQTFVIVDADEFWMGSPRSEPSLRANEGLHRRRIGRRFAISTKEITAGQFLRFQSKFSHGKFGRYPEPDCPDCPIGGVTWYEAAAYCNWLSEKEGIPKDQWCYEANEHGQYAEGMKTKANYLELLGYRLPTEAEWECACRAGTLTSRYYGSSEVLLPSYAWYQVNSKGITHPTGSLKPNDYGIFDMLGNVQEWCQGTYQPYALNEIVANKADVQPVKDLVSRVLRGAAFNDPPVNVRSAYRNSVDPDTNRGGGFRPARTYP